MRVKGLVCGQWHEMWVERVQAAVAYVYGLIEKFRVCHDHTGMNRLSATAVPSVLPCLCLTLCAAVRLGSSVRRPPPSESAPCHTPSAGTKHTPTHTYTARATNITGSGVQAICACMATAAMCHL